MDGIAFIYLHVPDPLFIILFQFLYMLVNVNYTSLVRLSLLPLPYRVIGLEFQSNSSNLLYF